MKLSAQPSDKKNKGVWRILIALCIGLAILCFSLCAVSAAFVFTEAPEAWEKTAAVLIVVVASFFVGVFSAKNAGGGGFLRGLIGGALFGALLWLLGFLLFAEECSGFSLTSVLTTAGAGMLGGIVGINMSKK